MTEEMKDMEAAEIVTGEGHEDETLTETDETEDEGVSIFDADAEDALEEALAKSGDEQSVPEASAAASLEYEDSPHNVRGMDEMMAIIEALIFVSEEPISAKTLADVLKEDRGWVEVAVEELSREFNARASGLQLREVA